MDLVLPVLHDMLDQKLLLLLESAVGTLAYLVGVFLLSRVRESSPWPPMVALVPFAALVSVAVSGVAMLFFFIATLGGVIAVAYLPLVTLATGLLGASFGAWAVAPRGVIFRVFWSVALVAVFAYLLALWLASTGKLA